jgi:hypothetical protein
MSFRTPRMGSKKTPKTPPKSPVVFASAARAADAVEARDTEVAREKTAKVVADNAESDLVIVRQYCIGHFCSI